MIALIPFALSARPQWQDALLHDFSSLLVETPKAFAAARTPFNWCCSLPNCFSSFLSSRLIAARMSMNP
jgi:hypothetical protein